MKCTYFIYDSIGMVGSQIAGGKERAILLWKKKFPNVAADAVGKLVAFDATSDKLPEGFIAERGKNPLVSGWSSDAIGQNIADAMRRRLPHAEAIAIALETARREYRKRHPTGPFPRHLKFIGKVRRKNPVMGKKWFYVDIKLPKGWGSLAATASKKEALEIAGRYTREHGTKTRLRAGTKPKSLKNPVHSTAKIVFNKLLGGWYVVTGPHHTPISGRFNSKAEAQDWLINRKNAREKNPVYSHIKVFKHGAGEKKFLKVGYFTGTGWDTDVKKAGQYSAGAARKLAEQLKIPAGWGLAIVSG